MTEENLKHCVFHILLPQAMDKTQTIAVYHNVRMS